MPGIDTERMSSCPPTRWPRSRLTAFLLQEGRVTLADQIALQVKRDLEDRLPCLRS